MSIIFSFKKVKFQWFQATKPYSGVETCSRNLRGNEI